MFVRIVNASQVHAMTRPSALIINAVRSLVIQPALLAMITSFLQANAVDLAFPSVVLLKKKLERADAKTSGIAGKILTHARHTRVWLEMMTSK